jgi:hypothetical protein
MEMPELMAKGFERIKQELVDKAILAIEKCNSVINNPDVYVRNILSDNAPSIDLNTNSSGTIYN